MERTGSRVRFVADPIGRYYVGSTYLVWCASPTLCGSVHWGSVGHADTCALIDLLEFADHPRLGALDVVMDARDVESVDWPSLRRLGEHVRPAWSRRIRRHAVISTDGTMLAGVASPYSMKLFAEPRAACEWLARDDAFAMARDVNALASEIRGISPVVRELREHLERALVHPRIEDVARACGISQRSLQRELQRAGTRFTDEVGAARLRAARLLLEHSDDKVEVVARRVGCGTSSRLSALFRRELRETPAVYRLRRRGAI